MEEVVRVARVRDTSTLVFHTGQLVQLGEEIIYYAWHVSNTRLHNVTTDDT